LRAEQHNRPHFTSAFGVIMTFIGVAVGLGNVWRFPYMAGAFGGGAFLLLYLIILGAFGIPAIMAEFTLGRATRRGPMGAFTQIGMRGGKTVGWVLFVTMFMAISYYSVIIGWVLRYFIISVNGTIGIIQPQSFFDAVLGGFWGQFWATAVVIGLVGLVLGLGIAKGVQRISSWGMPLLFLLLLVLIVRSVTFPGAGEGLRFYHVPDFSKHNLGVTTEALGQVFFSLSLGGTILLAYASYLPDSVNIPRSAIAIGLGETFAAVLAGFVIIPAAVSLGLELNSGPPLTFVTVPSIFGQIPAGALFGALFFGLLFFAAFLSDVGAFEVLIAGAVDVFHWPRIKAIVVFCGLEMGFACIPMISLDYLLKSDLFWGSTMQPVGSALALIGLAWVVGLGRSLEEANRGSDGPLVGRLWFYWIKYVIPAGIAVILFLGLRDLFAAFSGG
jgi:NSS family neurotransmitter:Na+ symporter